MTPKVFPAVDCAELADHPGIGGWIARRASESPQRTALVFGDTRRFYGELAWRVRRLAQGLRSLGVERGDRVVWLGPNHPAFLELLFAAAQIGAVLAPINHRLERVVVSALVGDVAPRVVFTDARAPAVTLPKGVAATVRVDPDDDENSEYERLIASAPDQRVGAAVTNDDLLMLPFTSGTTGVPKGIMLTHGNVAWNTINVLASIDVRAGDVTIAAAPFFRTGGTGVNVLPTLFRGGTVVIPRVGNPDEIFHLMERHQVTIGFGSPDLVGALARSPRWLTADFSRLRLFMTGGAPVRERLLRMCHERGFNLRQGYGLSEAGPFVSVLDEVDAPGRAGSAGRPAPFVEVRIVRPNGTEAGVEEVGDLIVRGPNVMTGYWKRPDATGRAFNEDGWLRTGDAAYRDAGGCLTIVGRAVDAYVSNRTVVHPGFAERVLLEHPSVAEAAVVASGHGAVAYVVLEAGAPEGVEEELMTLSHRLLPFHARPVAIQPVPSLPKNPAGKVMRHLIRDERPVSYSYVRAF